MKSTELRSEYDYDILNHQRLTSGYDRFNHWVLFSEKFVNFSNDENGSARVKEPHYLFDDFA